MIRTFVTKMSYYPVGSVKIKEVVGDYLKKRGLVSDAAVSIVIVGQKKMLALSEKYLNEKGKLHSVLSFTENEVTEKFKYPPDSTPFLGEVVICYPKVVEEAKKENKKIDPMVIELVEHGLDHLLGKHHE